jgi:hypothetical protein
MFIGDELNLICHPLKAKLKAYAKEDNPHFQCGEDVITSVICRLLLQAKAS